MNFVSTSALAQNLCLILNDFQVTPTTSYLSESKMVNQQQGMFEVSPSLPLLLYCFILYLDTFELWYVWIINNQNFDE